MYVCTIELDVFFERWTSRKIARAGHCDERQDGDTTRSTARLTAVIKKSRYHGTPIFVVQMMSVAGKDSVRETFIAHTYTFCLASTYCESSYI